MLYGCLLCVLRSQNPVKARQKLKDMKHDVDMKRARDAEERQVKGISEVLAVKNDVAKGVMEKHDDGAAGIGVDDGSEADLLTACSPQKLIIRQRPLISSNTERDVPKASVRKSLQESYPAISIKRVNDVHALGPINQDHTQQCTSYKPNSRETRTYSTETELNKIFATDSLNLANSLTKNSLIRNVNGLRSRLTGTSVSPNSKDLINDGHIEDYDGELFSSGSESFEDQMREIRDKSSKKHLDDARLATVKDTTDSTRESTKSVMKDNKVTVLNRVGTVNNVVMTDSERFDEQDEEASDNEAGQDDENSQSSNKQHEISSVNFDDQDMIDKEEFEEMNDELLSESNVSDDELKHESDSSLVLQDAQSMGVQTDDGGDDDVEDGVDDEVEGYVPQPMSEEQVSEQLSDKRDRGDL
jgi:hypothetical protein